MAKTTFAYAFKHLMNVEGGNSSNPKDPAAKGLLPGETIHTRFGVTQQTYSGWLKVNGKAVKPVRLCTLTEAEQIFRAQYWNAVKADDLPKGLDWTVADCAYNAGPSRAVSILQDCLGLKQDGFPGQVTMGQVASYSDIGELVALYCGKRLSWLKTRKGWGTFGKGWTNRVNMVQAQALKMVDGKKPAAKLELDPGEKGSEPKLISAPAIKAAVGTATGVLTAAGGEGLKATVDPVNSLTPWISWAPILGAVISIAAVGLGAYLAYKKLKETSSNASEPA